MTVEFGENGVIRFLVQPGLPGKGIIERRRMLANGVEGVFYGAEDGEARLYCLEFDEMLFTLDQARAWWEVNGWFATNMLFSDDAETVVEVDALLFEAGDYGAKGFYTEEHLDAIVENFSTVPLLIEHMRSRISTGNLVSIWREGARLMGKMQIFSSAYQWLKKHLGVDGLSVGLAETKDRIVEVSHTATPAIRVAQMFSDGFGLSEGGKEVDQAQQLAELRAKLAEQRQANAEMQAQLAALSTAHEQFAQRDRERDVDERLREWSEAGRVTPAQAPLARAFLLAVGSETTTFADAETSIQALFSQFIEAQPNLFPAGRLPAHTTIDGATVRLSDEQRRIAKLMGVDEAALVNELTVMGGE